MSYSSTYIERGIIGRGNFGTFYSGTAVLVENTNDQKIYIAKKIILQGLKDREIQGAYKEASLLSRLEHPNIVKYIESYCETQLLIIIMEYCEVGDLSFHVKQKRSKNEFFTELEIMNWFVEICMALQYIHSQGILHRDIKASNIYLTGNNTVKLGDFGISKILEGTEAAMTVVGTPYYMSPEVCENKPYSYKSDAWALGCVLYELCTLKHAFTADNLLGLVYKIVSETAEPIPSIYSPELKRVVHSLLIKDVDRRISISQLLKDPYIVNFMEGFINSNGSVLAQTRSLTIRKTIRKEKSPNKESSPSRNSPDQREYNPHRSPQETRHSLPSETPKERMARLKREKVEEEEERMKKATREAFFDNQVELIYRNKQRRQDMLYSSPEQRARNEAEPRELSGSGDTIASIAFTKRHSYDEQQDRLGTLTEDFYDPSVEDYQDYNTQSNYENYLKETRGWDTMEYSDTFEPTSFPQESYDERPITASGSYNLSLLEEEGTELAEGDIVELTQVVDEYRNQISGNYEALNPVEPSSPIHQPIVNRNSALRNRCISSMGPEVFEEVYKFLKEHRAIGTGDEEIRERAIEIWGRRGVDHCFLVDQLIFSELFS